MGFLSKVFKGVKKVFKKVGKGIKSAFKSIGKFMDKIGIIGQIGLSLLLPGIGSALSGMWGSLVGGMQAYSGIGSTIINGAGNFLNTATKIAGNIGKSFSTITEGVKNVVGETLKAGANALGVDTALIKAGTTLNSKYLTSLGQSISKANLTSISETFGASVDKFMGSFSGSGVDPTGAYETKRQTALMSSEQKEFMSGVKNFEMTPEIEAQRLQEFDEAYGSYDTSRQLKSMQPQFAQPDLATPDMPAGMTEVKVTADSLLAPAELPAAPSAGDALNMGEPSAIVTKQLAADADFLSIEAADFSDPQKRGFFGRAYDRLAAEGSRMLREAPTKAIDKLEATITDIPSQMARRAAGLDPDPTYTQVSYATVVPTIQEAPMVGAPVGMDPVQYVANNQQSMGLQPFGFNANMYNDATYMNTMRKYGYA